MVRLLGSSLKGIKEAVGRIDKPLDATLLVLCMGIIIRDRIYANASTCGVYYFGGTCAAEVCWEDAVLNAIVPSMYEDDNVHGAAGGVKCRRDIN